jgi:hypothetical protein
MTFYPGSDRLRARHIAFRRWALAASLGFLLLIPLQLSAGWKLHPTVDGNSHSKSANQPASSPHFSKPSPQPPAP